MSEQIPSQSIDFDEVVVFHNPSSTGAASALRDVKSRLQRLEDTIEISYVETSASQDELLEVYRSSVDPKANTITGVIGGDGTLNMLNAARNSAVSEYPKTALWAVGGGAGANLLRSTIDREYLDKPDLALELGRIVCFNTIEIEITPPDGESTVEQAVSVLGFLGTSAMISPVNEGYHRGSTLRKIHKGRFQIGTYLSDAPVILGGLITANPYFSHLDENGRVSRDFDTLFLNAPRVASIIYAPQVELTGPIHRVDVPRKRSIPSTLIKLRRGRSPGADLLEPAILRPLERVHYQLDGETERNGVERYIEAGSVVKISPSKEKVAVLTTL